jgi:psp operon transcriptional activator
MLANHFATRMAFELDYPSPPDFSAAARSALENYQWPGNVRELKNVVERAVYKAGSGVIDEIVFDPFESPYGWLHHQEAKSHPERASDQPDVSVLSPDSTAPIDLKQSVAAYEKELLVQAMEQCRYNQTKAAAHLCLSYDQLRGLLRKHGVK